MIDSGKKNVLGVLVNAIDYDAAVEKIVSAAKEKRALTATALAVHGVMTGVLDAEQRYRLNHLDLVVPDGQPVRWALNWLHQSHLADRVYGPTLMLKVCERAATEQLPVYLYGSTKSVLESLANRLTAKLPGLAIAGSSPSRFRQVTHAEKQAIIDEIRGSGAAIAYIGLGCPRQEAWVYEYRDALRMPLIAVGAAFDFHAGMLAQAPASLQKKGLEWLYRLYREPTRLWKRYLFLNPLYVAFLSLQMVGLKKFDLNHVSAPGEDLRYG